MTLLDLMVAGEGGFKAIDFVVDAQYNKPADPRSVRVEVHLPDAYGRQPPGEYLMLSPGKYRAIVFVLPKPADPIERP